MERFQAGLTVSPCTFNAILQKQSLRHLAKQSVALAQTGFNPGIKRIMERGLNSIPLRRPWWVQNLPINGIH